MVLLRRPASSRVAREPALSRAEKSGLRRVTGNDKMVLSPATNWHDGQISQNLSSPSRKNIPLNLQTKSFA
jgi:hypothetical protein